jgi:hypothetical protein
LAIFVHVKWFATLGWYEASELIRGFYVQPLVILVYEQRVDGAAFSYLDLVQRVALWSKRLHNEHWYVGKVLLVQVRLEVVVTRLSQFSYYFVQAIQTCQTIGANASFSRFT